MDAVEIRNVTKTFGRQVAVDDLSLSVPERCIYGFIGPNGSGKTTTMRMIMNILRADRGEIRVFGEAARASSTDRIGYMPEERGLYRKMRVREVLEFYGALKAGRSVREEVARWLERLALSGRAKERVGALSKGMSQKVQFIATVVARPALVILDEPFTGLDPVNADEIREAILELRAEGTTVILSTHDMHLAETMCDFIFMIHEGRKVLDGTLASIQDQYGRDALRIRVDDGDPDLRGLAGVSRVTDLGRVRELQLTGERDPQAIVSEILSRARVSAFELAKPSLHDIFVRIARPERKEASRA